VVLNDWIVNISANSGCPDNQLSKVCRQNICNNCKLCRCVAVLLQLWIVCHCTVMRLKLTWFHSLLQMHNVPVKLLSKYELFALWKYRFILCHLLKKFTIGQNGQIIRALKGNSTLKNYSLKWTFMFNKVTYTAWKWQFVSDKYDVWRFISCILLAYYDRSTIFLRSYCIFYGGRVSWAQTSVFMPPFSTVFKLSVTNVPLEMHSISSTLSFRHSNESNSSPTLISMLFVVT